MPQKNAVSQKNYLHHLMALVGLAALAIVMQVKQPVPGALVAEQTTQETAALIAPTPKPQPLVTQQQIVANWLAKRYRVGNDAAHSFVTAAYLTAKDFKLDPLLILSVMAIESGLNPFAESPVGAQGLMQVMSKIHQDKFDQFGGLEAALDPVANIRVGTQILKEYVTRGGSVEAGLKMYVGAALAETDGGYGSKVLAEYRRLKDVSSGKSVPVVTTAAAKRAVMKVAKPKMDEVANGDHAELKPLTKT